MSVEHTRPVVRGQLRWRLGLGVALLVVLVYHLLFFNRFFPVQEGWFSAYAHEILGGKTPYRDFYLFLPPVYPLLAAALIKLFGYPFLVFHAYGVAERLLLTALVYALLARVARPPAAALATVVSLAVYSASPSDTLYSYLQTCLVLSLAAGLLLLRVIDARANWRTSAAVLAGAAIGLAFFTKQSMGLFVLGAASATTALVVIRGHDPRRWRLLLALAAGMAVPAAVLLTWLGAAGALGPYFDDVYFGAALSKGSLPTILTGFVVRALNPGHVRLAAFICVTVIVWSILARRYGGTTEGRSPRVSQREALLIVFATAIPVWWFLVAERYRWWLAAVVAVAAGYAILPRLGAGGHTHTDGGDPCLLGDVGLDLVVGVAALAAVIVPIFAVLAFRELSMSLSFQFLLGALAQGMLCLTLVVGGMQLWRVWRRPRDDRAAALLLVLALGAAVTLANGLSFVVDETAAVPALGVITVVVLQARPWGKRFKDGLVVSAIMLLLVFCAAQKYGFPYRWWGWREPEIGIATQASRAPGLQGFWLSTLTDDTYVRVNRLIGLNVNEGEWLYAFPNIPLFYVMSGHYPRTFALVHYWDVCPDDVARRDARVLLSDPPAVIVEMVMPEEVWRIHEKAFRGGAPSGQRDIDAAIRTIVAKRDYRLLGEFPTRTLSVLRVWAAPVGSHAQGSRRRGAARQVKTPGAANLVLPRAGRG